MRPAAVLFGLVLITVISFHGETVAATWEYFTDVDGTYISAVRGLDYDGGLVDVEFVYGTWQSVFGAEGNQFPDLPTTNAFISLLNSWFGSVWEGDTPGEVISGGGIKSNTYYIPYRAAYQSIYIIDPTGELIWYDALFDWYFFYDRAGSVPNGVTDFTWYNVPCDEGYVWDWNDSEYMFAVLSPSVPIPGALWLLGSGLIGLVGIRRKFKKT